MSLSEPDFAQPLDSRERGALRFLHFEPKGAEPLPRVGQQVGDFSLKRELGRGGGGVVFEAEQVSLGRAVALKLVAWPSGGPSNQERRRALREGRLLATLRHPALVDVLAAGEEARFRWVAMELIRGANLRAALAGNGPGLPARGAEGWQVFCLDVLERIAGALGAAHAQGIVHRDVKPENVLLDSGGRAFLADFGLAREDSSEHTRTSGFVGTPRYAAPEQLSGEPVGPQADVFALGLLAFELLCGRPAFAGPGALRTEEAIRFRDHSWPADSRLSADLRAVVGCCLEKRPADRYPDGAAVAAELGRVRRLEPVQAVRRGPLARAWRRAVLRPRRAAAWLAVGLLVAAAGGAGALAVRESNAAERTEHGAVLDRAEGALHAGREAEAQRLLGDLLAGGAQPRVAGLLGDLALEAGEPAEAARLFRSALEQESSTADVVGLRVAERLQGLDVALPKPPPEARSARDHAALARWFADREPDRALGHLDAALVDHPTSFPLRCRRASTLRRLSRRDEALLDLRVAREVQPDDLDVVHDLAVCLMELKRFDEEEELLRRVLASQGDDAVLLADLAHCLGQVRTDFAESLALAQRAVDLDPDEPHALAVRAYALAWHGSFDEARSAVDGARARLPESRELALASGWVANLADDRTHAEAEARGLLAGDEPSLRLAALELLGAALRSDPERRDDAIAVYEELGETDGGRYEWAFRRGWLLYQAGRNAEAESALARAVALAPDRADVLLLHGQLLRVQQRWSDALLTLQTALAAKPGDPGVAYWLAMTWLDLGQPASGLVFAPIVQEGAPDWSGSWFVEALLAHQAEDYTRAAGAYERTLELDPHPAIRADYADSLARLGREREALAEFRRAREDDPELPTGWGGEGLLLLDAHNAALRDPAAAASCFERALALVPDSAEYAGLLARARERVGH
ncbi:MAG: tetratricopeptide repeat protein [Planctomycetota bacterium]